MDRAEAAQHADDDATTGPERSGSGEGKGVERLEGYRLALELAAVAPAPRGHAALRDQIDRAAASVVLTLAEGWGRW